MIIDAHNHPDWCGHDLSACIANMDEHGIGRTWLLTWECPADEFDPGFYQPRIPRIESTGPVPLGRCLAYLERAPDRFILGYAPDPRRPQAIDQLAAAVEVHGVRVCGELKVRMMCDNPDAIRMYRFCAEKSLPVVVHIDDEIDSGCRYPRPTWWYGGGIEAFERAIQKCPDTVFLGHAPGFWSHISGGEIVETVPYPSGKVQPGGRLIAMLRRYPNLYCDLSAGSGYNALNRDHGFARDFLLEFADRVLYARDGFDRRHQDLLGSLDLPPAVLERIYSGNALELVPQEQPKRSSGH